MLDLETTGFDEKRDRICQIAITIHYPTHDPIQWDTLVHPQCHIPKIVTEIHGITNEAVKDKPVFSAIAPALAPKMLNVDIMGFNVEFDIKFLRAEMKRVGVSWLWDGYVIDAYHIYRIKMPHNLNAAYKEFADAGELEGAHEAGYDVTATEIVLCGQLQRWPDLPRTVKELSDFCFPRRKDAIDKDGKFVWKVKLMIITVLFSFLSEIDMKMRTRE